MGTSSFEGCPHKPRALSLRCVPPVKLTIAAAGWTDKFLVQLGATIESCGGITHITPLGLNQKGVPAFDFAKPSKIPGTLNLRPFYVTLD